MKAKTVFKAILYGLIYFTITGILPLVSQVVTQLLGVVLDFEPRTVRWLIMVGIIIGIFVFIEKLIEERHPTGAGVFGILRYVVGLIDVTLYYNLLLHVGIIYPTYYANLYGITATIPNLIIAILILQLGIPTFIATSYIYFALYLVTLGLLIYGGYIINFFRYIYQMAAGYKLTKE